MPMPKFNFNSPWLIPAATALWAVWTWTVKHERDRKNEHARIGALYVKPFLSACEDLQSRIYSILELEGLHSLRKRYPDGSYAEETLYLIVRCLGWMLTAGRHGPPTYIEDPVVIRHASAVRSAFANVSSTQQVGPFNFFHPEQNALVKLLMTRFDGPYGVEFDTISCYEFKQRLASPPLSDSEAVKETLGALCSADDPTTLPGRDRLMAVQNHLVELLNYVEKKMGYTLFEGERKKCGEPTQLRAAAGNN